MNLDTSQLCAEEIRRLRLCGLAVRAWERERRKRYDGDRTELIAWAFGTRSEIPGLVLNYGPPIDTEIRALEEMMKHHGCVWREK